jgi:hypothetical protein
MTTATAVSAVGSGQGIVFGAQKMLDARAAMAAAAEYSDLIYKIAFFHDMISGSKDS